MIALGARAGSLRGRGPWGGWTCSAIASTATAACGPDRDGRPGRWPSADAVGLAMLFAYVNGQADAVDYLLEKDGKLGT